MMLRNVTQGTILLHSEIEEMWRSCLGGGFQRPGRKGGGGGCRIFRVFRNT
jgi:hypothetical protein